MSDLEKRAWGTALPRGEARLTPQEEFRRNSLTWASEWLRRAKINPHRSEAKPFAIVLSESPIASPNLDSHLIGREVKARPIYSYDCPMPFDVILVTSNLKCARGYSHGFNVASDVVAYLKSCDLSDRHALVIDPGSLAYGRYDPSLDADDFETITPELDAAPIELSREVVDHHLTRFHNKFLRLPNKFYGVQFWEEAENYKAESKAERLIHRALMDYFIALLPENNVSTDTEVTVPSGRADVRLLTTTTEGLRAYWLELKVLREQDGPTKRENNVRECIGQARARFEDARAITETAFACCYDASKARAAFDKAVQEYADSEPPVQFRPYPVLNKHYEVSSS